MLVGLARRHQIAAAALVDCLDLLEHHAGELSGLDDEFLRHQVIQDRNPLVLRVLLLPRARFHLLEAGAHDHLDVLAADTLRGPAAVHRGIAAAEHDDALADRGGMAERHRGEPVDADVDVLRALLAPGEVEVAAARRARADEERVVALAHQFLHGRYFSMYERDPQIEDVAHLLVDHLERQAEARDLRPDHAAGARILVEDGDLVAERSEVARHGERGRAGADAGDLLAVRFAFLGKPWADVVLVVGGHSFQTADRDRLGLGVVLFLDAAAAARGLARPVARAPEDAGKHVRFPVDHVGVGVTPCCNQPDVFGNGSVGGTGPLAIDNFMEVVGILDVCRLQRVSLNQPVNRCCGGSLPPFCRIMRTPMTTQLESLRKHSVVVADTGDIDAVARWKPQDATTNPSLLLASAADPRYRPLLERAMAQAGGDAALSMDWLFVQFGREILKHVAGRVSTEVDARLSFDAEKSIEKARRLVALYEKVSVGRERVLIKLASTWEGIRAAQRLEREAIHCNMTLLFSFAQAAACADAGVTLISPFVGRIYDWHRAQRKVEDIALEDDPGVASVARIYAYYKKHGYATQVMGASFRKTGQILALAGCDLLTIAPDLLEKLSKTEGEVTPRLTKEISVERLSLDEKTFRWMHNEDAMATDKLAEGIRRFDADARKLEKLIVSLAAAPAPAVPQPG